MVTITCSHEFVRVHQIQLPIQTMSIVTKKNLNTYKVFCILLLLQDMSRHNFITTQQNNLDFLHQHQY
jgi:hypothetical protein